MSKFTDILNKPLPSQLRNAGLISESADDDMDDLTGLPDTDTTGVGTEDCNSSVCEDDDDPEDNLVNNDDVNDIDDDDDDFDPDDLSDDELAALDAELSGKAVGSVAGDDDEVKLTPSEEIQADDMMSMAATTLLVNDELNAEEKAEFLENSELVNIAIDEGFLTEADVNEMAMDAGLVSGEDEEGLATEAKYTNKMIIRLDAASKKKQLYALAVNVSAAAHHDPDYIKLKKVMKMRKILRAKLSNKYHGEATKRMKIYFARLKKSKAAPLAKIGAKHDK